jgi:hypothetical protein
LNEQHLAATIQAEAVVDRTVLAQQMNQMSESQAAVDFAIARRQFQQNGGRFPFFRNGAVGYQPQITQLPEGTNMMGATAVVSADRRYVRFSPGLLSFSLIGEVQTFNFVTGDAQTQPGGVGGVGAGGVGGGGVGGIGGIGGGF